MKIKQKEFVKIDNNDIQKLQETKYKFFTSTLKKSAITITSCVAVYAAFRKIPKMFNPLKVEKKKTHKFTTFQKVMLSAVVYLPVQMLIIGQNFVIFDKELKK